MANNQIRRLLEFANLQMAAEAFLLQATDSGVLPASNVISERLKDGNNHTSKFMPVQADQFITQYEVLAQYRNDSLLSAGTGFSGTLFKNKFTGELTLSFRSTEFIDDAARDTKSTNYLEIKKLGLAFGQITAMEAWYAQLRSDPALLAGHSFNVTGYSLGGHLATAFNILRREQYANGPEFNPVAATYTFNSPGIGVFHTARLSDLIEAFNRIRTDYSVSSEWLALSLEEQNSIRALAETRVSESIEEQQRVAQLAGLNPSFSTPGPSGDQSQLGYQIAALVAGLNTDGISSLLDNPLTSGLITPEFADVSKRFANMTEVVGVESARLPLAGSFVSNSGIHYGNRQELHIENQPLYRGNWASMVVPVLPNLLVANPEQNDVGDTHSLVLIVDSLALMAAMEQLSPALTIEVAGQLFAAMSKAVAATFGSKQGAAEGDTLERMLDALRKLMLGPATNPTFTNEEMRALLIGGTWHQAAYRTPFHDKLGELRDYLGAITANPGWTFTIDPLETISAEQLSAIAQSSEAIAYRYALQELNPFAVVGDLARQLIYDQHNFAGALDLFDSAARTGTMTNQWIADRANFQYFKNIANINNVDRLIVAAGNEAARFIDLPQRYDLSIVPVNAGVPNEAITRRFVFGGNAMDYVSGGPKADRLFGGGSTDLLIGRGDADYLEGGKGLDVYQYGAAVGLFGTTHDGADLIRDIDGRGVLQYTYAPLIGRVETTVIAEASDKRSETEWYSANGRFRFIKVNSDLVIKINDGADGAFAIADFRNGDFGIYLRDARPTPQNPLRSFYGDKENYDSDLVQAGIQPVLDAFGNYQRADGQNGRPDIALPERADLFYGSTTAGDVEKFELGGGNDQAFADGLQLTPASGGEAWLQGGEGRDQLHGGVAADLIEGGGDGIFNGETGGDIAYGGVGNDELYADVKITLAEAMLQSASGASSSAKGDFLSGGEGDDWAIGSSNSDYLDGGGGKDLLIGGGGDDNIAGDYGNLAGTPAWVITREIVTDAEHSVYTLIFQSGTIGIDTGPADSDVIYAGAGNDWIYANGGDDYVDAGLDDDVVFGEAGADTLIGDDGDDLLVGDNPGFVLTVDEGGDYLLGGAGADQLFGNGGDDYVDGGLDDDEVFGDAGADILLGDAGNDLLVGDRPGLVLAADEGADYLDGGDGDDELYGNGGDDVLIGGAGVDNLFGDDGSDTLTGGSDADTLSGGAGKDTYIFNRGDGNDTIFDTDTGVNGPDASVLVLGEDIEREDISFGVGSLVVNLGNGDAIHFSGFDQADPNASTPLAEIRLADGTSVSYADILAQGFDIDGTQGNDNSQPNQSPNLVGTGVTDRIRGLSGDDSLFGLAGDDMLDGGEGADALVGGAGADTLYGGSGNDSIWGAGDNAGVIAADGADVIYGGDGGDTIEGGDGADQVFGEGDADSVHGQAGGDLIEGGDGNDTLYGDGLYFFIDQFYLNLFDDGAADTLRGGAGNDYLNGAGGNDVLEGGDGNDQLLAESGNDALQGDAGDDTLQAGGGDDSLTGGAGRDSLQGQDGNDTYYINVGDGEDTLADQSGSTLDIVRYGSGVAVGDIHFAHGPNNSLVAWHSAGTDQVTIQNWYSGSANKLDDFEFADATRISAAQAEALAATSWRGGSGSDSLFSGSAAADLMAGLAGNDVLDASSGNDILIGGSGDDFLYGASGNDTYRIGLGDGNDYILDASGVDTLVFEANVASTDISYERVGSDLLMHHANGVDQVTIGNFFAVQFVYPLETVTFAGDSASYSGFQVSNFATVIAHQYSLNLGDGAKSIEDWGGVDTLTFGPGIAKLNIQRSRVGADLKLAHNNGLDQVTIKDWFNDTSKQIENVTFSATGESFTPAELTDPFLTINGTSGNDLLEGGNAYGETLNGLAGNDTINGRGGNDSITGGLGNDTLNGGKGPDRYFFKTGDGNDVINEDGTDTSVLQLGPGLIDVMNVASINGGRRLTFTGSSDSVDVIEPGPNFTLFKGELNGTSAANTLNGNNTFGDVIQGLGGNDTLNGRGGNDEIHGGTGNDTITGGEGYDQLWGDEGDDILDGNALGATGIYQDQFWGGTGNDTLYGGYWDDSYYYNRNEGLDVIIEEPFLDQFNQWSYSLADQLIFGPGITPEMLTVAPMGNDLLVTISPTEKITLRNWISDYHYRVDEFVFSDGSKLNENQILALAYTQRGTAGNDTLTGTTSNDALYGLGGNDTLFGSSGHDVLDGGSGNDTLDGGSGDDRYLFAVGSGQDRIVDGQGNDRVEFAPGLSAGQISIGRSLNSMVLAIAGTADTITIDNALINSNARVENFLFTDASTLPDLATMVNSLVNVSGGSGNDVLQGTSNFDVLYGLAGNDTLNALGDSDTLFGGADNDILNGGPGNDNLQGEAGNDTYTYFVGDGADVINDTAGSDVVAFAAGIATSAVIPTRTAANLVLNVNVAGNAGTVTVENYFNAQETELIRFADGTSWDVASVRSRVLTASITSGNDVVYGYETDDTINSLAGNDTVYGGAGNDSINGGTGNDTLYGEDGNDTLSAGTGDPNNASIINTLYGGNGNDVLIASGKTDSLLGEAGNDIAIGAGESDTLQESSGSNLLFGAAGNDSVRMGDGNDIALGGTGNDTIDGDFNGNGIRGRDVLAFNKSDGSDTVSRLGAGSTLSIGGGTLYSNLSFAFSGANLLLKTSNSNYVSLTNWYGNPVEKTLATLQIVIEGTSNYNASSSNPLNNRKIQTFDFLGLAAAYDAAGRPSNFSIANNLAAYRIGGSDTAAIGGALAYQYARTSNLGTLTYAQMQAVVNDSAFAVAAQSIDPPAALLAESSTFSEESAAFSGEALRTEYATDASEAIAAQAEEPRIAPTLQLDEPKVSNLSSARTPSTSGASVDTDSDLSIASTNGAEQVAPGDAASVPANLAAPDVRPEVILSSSLNSAKASDGNGDQLVMQWFGRDGQNDDLTLLDDILRGDDSIAAPPRVSSASAWDQVHGWLNRHFEPRADMSGDTADAADLSGLAYFGLDTVNYDMPRALVGLTAVAGHEIKIFKGLQT